MLKASQLVSFCQKMVGMPYWYGTCVYQCTQSLLSKKAKQYPNHYYDSRMKKYQQNIADRKVCMDCIGLIKGFFWTNGGEGVLEYTQGGEAYKSKYGGNNCPDKGAKGMRGYIRQKGCKNGNIDTLPEVPGVLVFTPTHVGVYIGGGYVIEAKGFSYGVVKTELAKRPWKYWGYLPDTMLEYDTEGETPVTPEPEPIPKPEPTTYSTYTVKRGDTLWNISRDLLGRGQYWRKIAELNGITGTIIHTGDVLKIPT